MLPVDPVRIGCPASRSDASSPSARANPSRLPSSGPNFTSPCRIQRNDGLAGSPSSVTSTGPIPSSRLNRVVPSGSNPSVASTHDVPMVGCPANGTSRAGVKMRTRAAQSPRVGFRRKVVSEQFISRAIFCITPPSGPSAPSTTASGFPPNTVSVNTSTCKNLNSPTPTSVSSVFRTR